MRIMKQRLLELLPDVCVFLDVDDLKEGKGAEYVDVSVSTLVFCSAGYFASPNCMREILRAKVTKKQVIALLELEEKHGGMARDEIRAKLREDDEPCEKHGTQYPNKYTMWGLAAEVQSWGYALPTGQQLFDALFAHMPIEWNRIGAFQDVTLRLVAARIIQSNVASGPECSSSTSALALSAPASCLSRMPALALSAATSRNDANDSNDDVFVQGELANQQPSLREPMGTFHVYCSEHNLGALALMGELATVMNLGLQVNAVKQRTRQQERSSSSQQLDQLRVSSEVAALHICDNMLVYLNDQTWTRGDSGSVQLAADVHEAMDAGASLLLAHEMVGVGQDGREPCEFGNFFACDRGTTPQELLRRGIYDAIATPLKGLQWRQASMVMLLNALTPCGTLEADALDVNARIEQLGLLHRVSKGRSLRIPSMRLKRKSQSTTQAQQASVSVEMGFSAVDTAPSSQRPNAARANAVSVSAVTVDSLETEPGDFNT